MKYIIALFTIAFTNIAYADNPYVVSNGQIRECHPTRDSSSTKECTFIFQLKTINFECQRNGGVITPLKLFGHAQAVKWFPKKNGLDPFPILEEFELNLGSFVAPYCAVETTYYPSFKLTVPMDMDYLFMDTSAHDSVFVDFVVFSPIWE